MNFWNRELVTGLDCVWDFVDNVSPLPSYSTFIRKGFFFKQGRNKHVRGQLPHRRSRLGTLWILLPPTWGWSHWHPSSMVWDNSSSLVTNLGAVETGLSGWLPASVLDEDGSLNPTLLSQPTRCLTPNLPLVPRAVLSLLQAPSLGPEKHKGIGQASRPWGPGWNTYWVANFSWAEGEGIKCC